MIKPEFINENCSPPSTYYLRRKEKVVDFVATYEPISPWLYRMVVLKISATKFTGKYLEWITFEP